MPTLPYFDICARDFLPRVSYLTFPAVLKDESSLSILSKCTAVTNEQTKLLATPGITAVSSSMVRTMLKISPPLSLNKCFNAV